MLGRLLNPDGDLALVSEFVSNPVLWDVESAGLCKILLNELSRRCVLSIPIVGISLLNSFMLGFGSNIL